MPKLFISYRRSDTEMVAGRLRDSLARRLGERAIFRDKNSIAAGEDWTKAIEQGLGGDVVVLALIGPSWATARDATGRQRLDDPADWNRVELERAFGRHRRVIPLLVDDAKMPAETELPESLKALTRSNALKLRDDDWDSDIEKLVRALRPASRIPRTWIAAAIAVLFLGAVGYWWYSMEARSVPPPVNPSNQNGKDAPVTPGSYREAILQKLIDEQNEALGLMQTDKPQAIRLIDANLGGIAQALRSFPDDADLHALAGYAAKNVYASSKGVLPPETRKQYLARARQSFEQALRLDPKNPSAVNGIGNVLFYEGRIDDAISRYQEAIKLAGGKYDAAAHDLDLARRVKSGKAVLDP